VGSDPHRRRSAAGSEGELPPGQIEQCGAAHRAFTFPWAVRGKRAGVVRRLHGGTVHGPGGGSG
jgi:hypothetical protein